MLDCSLDLLLGYSLWSRQTWKGTCDILGRIRAKPTDVVVEVPLSGCRKPRYAPLLWQLTRRHCIGLEKMKMLLLWVGEFSDIHAAWCIWRESGTGEGRNWKKCIVNYFILNRHVNNDLSTHLQHCFKLKILVNTDAALCKMSQIWYCFPKLNMYWKQWIPSCKEFHRFLLTHRAVKSAKL